MSKPSNKVIITCAITGGIHTPSMSDALPYKPEDIAAQSIAAAEAGAAILHLHARNPETGEPTGDPHAAATGIRAQIALTIPALTLMGESEDPATLQQHGPIDLDTATRLAGDSPEWVRLFTDPVTGVTVTADVYRPPPKLKKLLQARDGRCRFPTCNANVARTDLDHTRGWVDGGTTTPDNLACLCRGHHTLKTLGLWKVQATAPGILE